MTNWRLRANCRGEDRELFFPIGQSVAARAQEAEAQRVCADCAVRSECLQEAIERGEKHGIFGGHNFERLRSGARAALRETPAETGTAA